MMPPSTKRHEHFWTKFSNSGHSGTYVRMGEAAEAAEAAEVLRSNSLYDVLVCASRISLYSLYHVLRTHDGSISNSMQPKFKFEFKY